MSEPTTAPAAPVYPAFLKLAGRRVLVVGAGPAAAAKVGPLLEAGACVTVVAPVVCAAFPRTGVTVWERKFAPSDLNGMRLAIAAAPPDVNAQVAAAARERNIFLNAVDDVANATMYAGGVVRRGGVTIAISTDGEAPALAALVREAVDALLPQDIDQWMSRARELRAEWKGDRTPMEQRRPRLLEALNNLYAGREAGSQ